MARKKGKKGKAEEEAQAAQSTSGQQQPGEPEQAPKPDPPAQQQAPSKTQKGKKGKSEEEPQDVQSSSRQQPPIVEQPPAESPTVQQQAPKKQKGKKGKAQETGEHGTIQSVPEPMRQRISESSEAGQSVPASPQHVQAAPARKQKGSQQQAQQLQQQPQQAPSVQPAYPGAPTQGYQGLPPQGYHGPPPQGYHGPPPQGYHGPPPQGYQGVLSPGLPPPGLPGGPPPQGYLGGPPPQGYLGGPPPRAYPGGPPPQGYPGGAPPQGQPRGAPPQGYPGGAPQGYPRGAPPQGYPRGAPPQGYPRGAPPQGYPRGAPPQGYHGGAPPQQYLGAPQGQEGPQVGALGQQTQPPQPLIQQQSQPERGPTPVQEPRGARPQKPKGPQKGVSPTETPTREMAKMQISQLKPMEYIKAKPGVKGRKIPIETNHLQLNLGRLQSAIHYDLNIVPDTPKKYLRPVVELFRQKYFKNRYIAFDGRKNAYSTTRLPFGDFQDGEIIYTETDGREKKYKIEMKFANEVDLRPLLNPTLSKETPREALQVVDIVLRSAPASQCISVGRSFFVKPPTIIDLGEGMEMYSGFYQSAIRGWKPFLNVDVAHKAFPKNINVIDAMIELFGTHFQPFNREDLSRPLTSYNLSTFGSFIKTLRVSYEIPSYPSSRRVYRVNGIDDPPKDKIFTLDNGKKITIERYFAQEKNYRLRYPHLPSLWVGSLQRENKILLPVELCTLVEGQVTNRKMTENQTSAMIKHAATNTQIRKDKIMAGVIKSKHNEDPVVKEFGFSVGNTFEKLEARVLNPPQLAYGDNKKVNPSRGVWRGERFLNGSTINKWTIACVDRRPPRQDDLSRFADMIRKNAAQSGMVITANAELPFAHIGGNQSLPDIKKYFQTQKEKGFNVIFVIVPNSGPQYSHVKTAAEINVGCLTQCIKMRTLLKMNPQTAINILLKVNSKLNGTNHCLLSRPLIMNRPCMIMGADVTHPSPDARDIPSVAAVTASHDPKAFKYNICWRLQPPKVEIIEDLEAIIIEQLKYFFTMTKVKPERIVFFRDGVSEGQFDQVRNAEIRAIRSGCKKIQADGYEPSITFLVVQKRHHTRLFPLNPRDSEDKNVNVPAGTCVDTTITHPFMQDFYLVSHASIQGVAKPTKYCTLWDDNAMSNDDIEELSYYLCHMFTRCNRSVSYPAPTYYAHLAAARAKVYIENSRLDLDHLDREYAKFQILDVIRKDQPMFFV